MILAGLAGLYVAGFVAFVRDLPQPPTHPVHADGIVVLTGGEARLKAGDKLLEQGAGRRLLITGVHPNITKRDIMRVIHVGRRFDCCADLGFRAMNTHGNATEAARWAHAHGYKSLVIVTANYHMPRSLREFSTAMPHIRLFPYPVRQSDVDVADWWRDPRTLRTLDIEYDKYLGSLVLTALGVEESGSRPAHPSSADHDRVAQRS